MGRTGLHRKMLTRKWMLQKNLEKGRFYRPFFCFLSVRESRSLVLR